MLLNSNAVEFDSKNAVELDSNLGEFRMRRAWEEALKR